MPKAPVVPLTPLDAALARIKELESSHANDTAVIKDRDRTIAKLRDDVKIMGDQLRIHESYLDVLRGGRSSSRY